jgi:hypothetical protein
MVNHGQCAGSRFTTATDTEEPGPVSIRIWSSECSLRHYSLTC